GHGPPWRRHPGARSAPGRPLRTAAGGTVFCIRSGTPRRGRVPAGRGGGTERGSPCHPMDPRGTVAWTCTLLPGGCRMRKSTRKRWSTSHGFSEERRVGKEGGARGGGGREK